MTHGYAGHRFIVAAANQPPFVIRQPGDAVAKEIALGRADIGIAGMYMTSDRAQEMDLTFAHSQDCAVFITLMSTALPRYRAILGPFHWHVWVALTFTYLIGILPLAFSDKHTLRHLINNAGEVENMFWYVFGTFTNCFTFTDRGGWERWFFNSSDPKTNKLMRKLELVPNVESGIRNTTKAFFWPYAFLGSQAELEYIKQANFSVTKSKRAQLHISNECFVPFGVIMGFPNNSLYTAKLSADIMRISQSGLMDKLVDETRWEIQRSPNGKYLAVSSGFMLKITSAEEKGLTLEDTQGMFLLLAAGFLLAATALLSEWMGGFTKKCRELRKKIRVPSSLSREKLITPKSSQVHEIKNASDLSDSVLGLDTRPSSVESRETLDGQIINVTEENIIVHNNLEPDDWDDSRRSSSADVEKEVRAIFERDQNLRRTRISSEEVIDLEEEANASDNVSNGAFGDHLK
ncbi:ionotropic receptor 21a [Phthorimaea operculella]|nr:ionotropic receptor 21a [Phthorimaea operculella]